MISSKNPRLSFLSFIALYLLCLDGLAGKEETPSIEDESALKCDACKIIAQKFAKSFKTAEAEAGGRQLNEDEYIEAAEGTCDEEWSGYGVRVVDGIQRLAGEESEVALEKNTNLDHIWDRRLQDLCDELLAECPDERTLYNLWSAGDVPALHKYLCQGEGLFKACVPEEDFGPWPGDDYDDYDDMDFYYTHDEF